MLMQSSMRYWREKQEDFEAYISSSSSSLRNHSSRYLLAINVPRAEILINNWLIFPSNSRKQLLPMILSLASCICRVILLDFVLFVFQLPSANQSSQLTMHADDQNHSPLNREESQTGQMQSCAPNALCLRCLCFCFFLLFFPVLMMFFNCKRPSSVLSWLVACAPGSPCPKLGLT